MTLDDFLRDQQLTNAAFAAKVGTDQSTIARLRKGQVPTPKVMLAILEHTGGKVRPDDFYGVAA